MNWYALHCRSNTEKQVAERLAGAGVEGFYPHLVRKSKDKRRDIELKFFPGYVFARFDLEDKTPVVAIPQVVSILGWGRHAVALPDFEIEAVRQVIHSSPVSAAVKPCLFVADGDRVRVRYGPLAGLEGFVCYTKTGGTRVIVSVTMLARSVSAEVDGNALELLEAAIKKAA